MKNLIKSIRALVVSVAATRVAVGVTARNVVDRWLVNRGAPRTLRLIVGSAVQGYVTGSTFAPVYAVSRVLPFGLRRVVIAPVQVFDAVTFIAAVPESMRASIDFSMSIFETAPKATEEPNVEAFNHIVIEEHETDEAEAYLKDRSAHIPDNYMDGDNGDYGDLYPSLAN